MRKIVEIVCTAGELTALCDDGTVWHRVWKDEYSTDDREYKWVRGEDIPQDGGEEENKLEKFDVNELTLDQVKEIQKLVGAQAPSSKNDSCYPVGKNVIVRTITMIYTGKLSEVTTTDLILTDCSWIPETARYADFVEKGSVKECEPFPDALPVYINRGALLDMCELRSALPREQR